MGVEKNDRHVFLCVKTYFYVLEIYIDFAFTHNSWGFLSLCDIVNFIKCRFPGKLYAFFFSQPIISLGFSLWKINIKFDKHL